MGFAEVMADIKNKPWYKEVDFDPSKMTDKEIAQLRFGNLTEEQEKLVEKELKKRGYY